MKLFRKILIILLAVFTLSFPIRELAADYYYRQVADILDDKRTENLDVKTISEGTLPSYRDALGCLKTAAAITPANAAYPKALSELYARLGLWSESMEALNTPVPALSAKDALRDAVRNMETAVSLDPLNPDSHLALGRLYERMGAAPLRADRELKLAEKAAPGIAALRHALAMHYLLADRKGDALEQARILARIDDTYILPDTLMKSDIIERRPPGYLQMLSQSYLYSALEIAWRISKDPDVVKGITPDTSDAAQVLALFLERKGK